MAKIPVHPSVLADETEESARQTKELFVKAGLMREEDEFVADPNAPDDDEDPVIPANRSRCKDVCDTAYRAAKAACNLTGNYKKCRKKAKAAWQVCVAACDLTDPK